MQLALDNIDKENADYLKRELITYIGNKRGLLPFIGQGVAEVKSRLGRNKMDFIDLFSGSGVVSRFMKQHSRLLISNDFEKYTEVVNSCYLANQSEVNISTLTKHLKDLQDKIVKDWRTGFISELYAPKDDADIQPGERVFYTRRNAEYIDTTRQHIASLPLPIQKFFLGPLLVGASIHNNTGGVFKGFYKNQQGIGAFGGEAANALKRILGEICVHLPTLSRYECDYQILCQDSVGLAKENRQEFDLAYIDPPYNQHPYGSNYFMLNLINDYQRPVSYSSISGIPVDWNRSPFNKKSEAKNALLSIIRNLNAKFFLISYNGEGFIKKDEFVHELEAVGKLTTLETNYNTYRASRNLKNRSTYVTEYLFLLEKR